MARSLVVALLVLLAGHARASSPDSLVVVRRGELPILITAPHGGREAIPGVAPRNVKDPGLRVASIRWGGAVDTQDSGTEQLALVLAEEIGKLTGRAPYLVVAKFHRRYIDANRPVELALENDAAKAYYAHYHRAIRGFVDEIRGRHPAGLLLDVHGQGKLPDTLARGTRNGRSITKLYQRAGAEGITGPKGLFGLLESQGFRVAPANNGRIGTDREVRGLDGGYTVLTYGSDKADGIDAFLLEFGTTYRRADRVARTAAETARAVAAFYAAHLK